MTAPTQPPDPQLVTQLARAIQTSTSSGFAGGAMIAEAIDALITERLRVLVEELGGREGPVMPVHSEYVRHERRLFDALVKHAPVVQMSDDLVGDVVKTLEVLAESLNACRAQQWENAETIKALTERANVAAPELDPRISGWMDVCKTLDDVDPTWSTRYGTGDAAILAIRTLAQTAKDATARAEAAEAANMELDNARKSAEQSARDLRENNATLRAELDAINTKTEHDQALMDTQAKLIVDLETELDAIKGAQVPYRWTVVVKDRMSFTFTSLGSAQTWANGEGGEVIPLYRHPAPSARVVKQLREMVQSMYDTFYADNGVPIEVMDDAEGMLLQISNMVSGLQRKAPAARVVGACVVGVLTAKTDEVTNCTSFHIDTSKYIPSKIVPPDGEYDIWIGAPLPTEGGK